MSVGALLIIKHLSYPILCLLGIQVAVERSEPCLAARRPTASDDMKSDEGLLESLIRPQQTFER